MDKVILFNKKDECCGCGACLNICPKQAISMQQDEYGFLYPKINEILCIGCKLCKKVCYYQSKKPKNEPIKAYAAVNKNEKQLLKSASGGVFSAIATQILNEGGVVFGATLTFENGKANPHHIYIDSVEDLIKLQGSKYVQSSLNHCYKKAKFFLENEKKVLFSGTPCQIGGLYGYLAKDYDNLLTVDVICHGVPNTKIFNDFLQNERDKNSTMKVIGYSFRDKLKGWGMNTRIDFIKDNSNKFLIRYSPARLKSYNTFFLDGDIYRENCYSCKYAGKLRVSDLTIGDYWGIEKEHPELKNSNSFDEKKGISCILINTHKGLNFCKNIKNIYLFPSTFDKISKKNEQLKNPTKLSSKRNKILEMYKNNNYSYIDNWFYKVYRKQIIIHSIFNRIPRNLRLMLKSIFKN